MSVPHRVHGVRVLKAVSSSLRLQILNLLFDRGPLSYTELMNSLKMNPSRDAGRFAYHLKFLLKADLVEADVESRKYCLTDLGKMIIEVADRIEKKTLKPKRMLVRASRFAMEEFDVNKIANSLIEEARMPAELAQKVAKEAEKRLLKSRTKYLSAPLVREIVNAILIEKGLEDYRHKLTRLGLPVHEVSRLVEGRGKTPQESASIHEVAGEAVLSEYVLLKAFPRDIADAHLSGSIHVNDLGMWVVKPSEVMHDLRFFYQNGLDLQKVNPFQPSLVPPKDFEQALFITLDVFLHSAREVGKAQTLNYANVFLAPFARGSEPAKIKDTLRSFLLEIAQYAEASIGLELTMPSFIADKPAVGPFGKPVGKYSDFREETQMLASTILDIALEENKTKPLFNPKIIVRTRPDTFTDERAKALLLKAHSLPTGNGIAYFACSQEPTQGVFSGSGSRLEADLSGDWEIDTLRTGCLGTVAINLPRIAYESEKDKAKFLELLRGRLELASRAFEIKYGALKQHGAGLLPFVMQSANGDRYFRIESSTRLLNLVGLEEALEVFFGRNPHRNEEALKMVDEVAQCVSDFVRRVGRKHGKRLLPAIMPDTEASERLAQLDIDRYGLGKTKFSGTREKPFYSTVVPLTVQDGQIPQDLLALEHRLRGLRAGGSLSVIELGESEFKPDELLALTSKIIEVGGIEFFTYNRKLTYCTNCRKSWSGSHSKCPSCGAVGALMTYDRFASSRAQTG